MQILFISTEARTSAVDRATDGKHSGTPSNSSFGLIGLAELPYLGQNLPYLTVRYASALADHRFSSCVSF